MIGLCVVWRKDKYVITCSDMVTEEDKENMRMLNNLKEKIYAGTARNDCKKGDLVELVYDFYKGDAKCQPTIATEKK